MVKFNTHLLKYLSSNRCVIKDETLPGDLCLVIITAVETCDTNWTSSLSRKWVAKAQSSIHSIAGANTDRIHKRDI